MQAVDPARLKLFDKNNDRVVNGHDWMLMSASERKETAIFLCGTYTKVKVQIAGKDWESVYDTELARLINSISSRVEYGLNIYYQKYSHSKALISTQAIWLYEEEIRYLEKLSE